MVAYLAVMYKVKGDVQGQRLHVMTVQITGASLFQLLAYPLISTYFPTIY